MDQKRIKELLDEAESAICTPSRANQIQSELEGSTFGRESGTMTTLTSPGTETAFIVASLFSQTFEKYPDFLPFLFPAFAIMCGDRKKGMNFAEVNWDILDID